MSSRNKQATFELGISKGLDALTILLALALAAALMFPDTVQLSSPWFGLILIVVSLVYAVAAVLFKYAN